MLCFWYRETLHEQGHVPFSWESSVFLLHCHSLQETSGSGYFEECDIGIRFHLNSVGR